MKINYPNGRTYNSQKRQGKKRAPNMLSTYSNRGRTLEEDLNETNAYYLAHEIAIIHKKPTPVQIVNVDYPHRSAAVISEAYFKRPSTTDYNGVYKGKHLDFEAKETRSSSSFPLKNIHDHQMDHMNQVVAHGGIAFLIIRFAATDEIFFLTAEQLFQFWQRMLAGGRKSVTKAELTKVGVPIRLGLHPRIDYIQVIDDLYGE